ncbi:MAG: citrate synthase, partial [Oscillospiraceae bacterium]
YRGIDVCKIIEGCTAENRYSFEETVWLLIFGKLPDKRQYQRISQLLYENRELPEYFPEDVIMKNPSKDIMNKLARGVLTLYSYDENPDDLSLENNMRQSISLIARMPAMMSYAYQVKRRHFDKKSMYIHPFEPQHKTAEAILNAVREDKTFSEDEAKLLDLCMTLHAEHGGGNNSTFTARVLSSADTDIYSTIGAAIGSLKGFKHGGANLKVREMMDHVMEDVQDWGNEDELEAYLQKIVRGEAADKSGLIYGMGHAIYTKSDPRAIILKTKARELARTKGLEEKFALYERVEKLSPDAFRIAKGNTKVISANVDFYSGLVYQMLGIPQELFTPLFAVSRIPGWCAHRIEELTTGGRIIRPAYKALATNEEYIPIEQR